MLVFEMFENCFVNTQIKIMFLFRKRHSIDKNGCYYFKEKKNENAELQL